jgi:hypothetical protein
MIFISLICVTSHNLKSVFNQKNNFLPWVSFVEVYIQYLRSNSSSNEERDRKECAGREFVDVVNFWKIPKSNNLN